MTVQAQESLEYKGEKYNLIGLPFESYLELNKNISMDFHYTTANRRGYQGYWKIENNKLFLTNLKSSYYTFEQLFNSTEPIHADWYSGVLEFGFGNFKPNHWWGTYENYLWLKIEKGNVIEKRIRQGIDEYDYDQFVNFGIYKNQNVKDLLFGKINSYNDDVIINYINAIFTSFLDENKIALKATVEEITDKLCFKRVKEIDETVIYAEPSLAGYNAVTANYHKEDSKLDMELLFNAVLTEKNKLKPIFN